MTSAADLLTLQDIDLRRDSRRALIADIESRLVETDELIDAREELQASEQELAQLRRSQQEMDAQLQDLDAKIRPLETKLYGGSVRNAKELSDLQKEFEALKARRNTLDDKGLAALDKVETANTNVSRAKTQLEIIENQWRDEQAGLLQDKQRAEKEDAKLYEERSRWAASIDALTMGAYENLRTAKQGRAVARVERGTCQGCRVTLPTQLVQQVRTGNVLIRCPRCERILVGA